MNRILIAICFFLLAIVPVSAQEKIFLPVIGGNDMAQLAILEVSDGTTTVNLLQGDNVGFHLLDWDPKVVQPKGGGVFQDSTLAPHRQIVSAVDANAIETFDLKVNEHGQDSLIRESQDLMRLLVKARNYSLTEWQDDIVWIKKQAKCETNPQYTFIANYNIPELDNPYAQPFFSAGLIATMDNFTLEIERQHWLAVQPGTSECVETSSTQVWPYAAIWDEVDTGAIAFTFSDILEVAGDGIYATSVDNLQEIKKSVDGGDTWAVNLNGAPLTDINAVITSFLLAANGDIYACSTKNLIRTQNNGGAWAEVSTGDIWDIVELANGDFVAVGEGATAYRSIDGGDTFVLKYTTNTSSRFQGVVQADNGDVVALDLNMNIHISTDNGENWVQDNTIMVAQAQSRLRKFSDGNLYTVGAGRSLYFRSTDNGRSWGLIYTADDSGNALKESPNVDGLIYSSVEPPGTDDVISFSNDFGFSWQPIVWPTGTGAGAVSGNEILANGDLLYIITDNLYKLDLSATTTLGRGATCNNEVFVSNKSNQANLTHVKIDDGGAFTDIFPISSFPQSLLPAVPAVNDALYLGIDSSHINAGTFADLVFDLSQENTGATLTWEYYNGAWVALTIHDGTASAESLARLGVNSVNFVVPSDWIAVAIDGDTAYWVRATVSGTAGTLQVPQQDNRDIYTVVQPFVDIDELQVIGDIPALAQVKIQNRSDEDGVGGSGPDLYDNRLLVGLRSVSRGSIFNAYINLSDEQLAEGTIAAVGTNTVFADDVATPTTRRMTYSAAIGDTSFVDRATVSFSSSTVRDFYGRYHLFLRAKQHTGSAGDIDVRIQVRTGSGGITQTSSSKQFQTTDDWQLLDFDSIRIPTSSILDSAEIGDENIIAIQAKNTSGATRTVYFYDIILLPVDEWALDAIDMANINGSIIGRQSDLDHLLDIDSLTNFKRDIRTLVKVADSQELVVANYNAITNGSAILQANADQRLWFLSARYGSSDEWVSEPWIVHSIQVFNNARYLGLRGDR